MYIPYLGILCCSYLFSFICCLHATLSSLSMAQQPVIHREVMCDIYHWLLPILSGLRLMQPDIVITSPLLPFQLFFLILILGASYPFLWSCSPSALVVKALTPSTCWSKILFSYLLLWYAFTSVPAVFGLNTLLCSIEFASMNVSSKHPVPFTICCLRHCSATISVLWMSVVLYVTNLPIFVPLTMYDHQLWLLILPSTITACIHGPPSITSLTTQ